MKLDSKYLKKEFSNPFNYTGSKHRYLADLFSVIQYGESESVKVLDPFVGGGDLISKLPSSYDVTASDISLQLIELHIAVQTGQLNVDGVASQFKDRGMSKTNREAYLRLRVEYNESPTPEKLYLLMTNSFNNQLRFNLSGGFNMPFGKDRSSFNSRMQSKLANYQELIRDGRSINFVNKNYLDFDFSAYDLLLIDPPYSNTVATYNESTGWAEAQDVELFKKIDESSVSGTKFVYFNQVVANGIVNDELDIWSKKHNVRVLKTTTNNCAATKKKGTNTVEIMVWN